MRWAAGRLRPFLVTASPPQHVAALPASRRTGAAPRAGEPAGGEAARRGRRDAAAGAERRRVPAPSLAAAALGPTLVVAPSVDRARLDADPAAPGRPHRGACCPHEWALAAGGVDVVIGARAAAWAPCPGLAAAVVLDEHDEALQEERSPTWHARDVVVERARRAGRAGAAGLAVPDA